MENEHIISIILSFTSPKDVCRCSIISKIFNSASESDTVWEHFLPSDYEEIIARSASRLTYSSKKQLFFQLTNSHILLDGGKLSFQLSEFGDEKCFMISARELQISRGKWISVPESRFTEVAKIKHVSGLEIQGKIQPEMLSLNTGILTIEAYLLFKFNYASNHLHHPCRAFVKIGRIPTFVDVERTNIRTDGWRGLSLGVLCIDENYYDDLSNVEIMFWETSEDWERGITVEGLELTFSY